MVLEVIWGGIVQMWGIAAVAKRCQTYKVWTQVSFDFPFYFILFYFILFSILGTRVRILVWHHYHSCHKSHDIVSQ